MPVSGCIEAFTDLSFVFNSCWRLRNRASKFVANFPGVFVRVGMNWGFVRNFAILSGGSVLAQLFNVALMPVITRLYGPKNFGQLALFMAFFSVAIVAASLNYEYAIVSARNNREAAQLTFCSVLLSLPTSLIAGFAFYGLVRFGILGYGSMPFYTAVLIVPALICAACFSTLRYWLLRQERFGLISRGTVIQNAGRALVQSGLGCLGPHTVGLLAGEIIGRCASMGRMLRAAWPVLKVELAGSNLPQVKDTLKRNRHFALYSLPSSLLDTLAASISFPLVVYFYGLNTGGSFALVARALALPAVLITANVADAFHSKAALLLQEDPKALPGFLKRVAAVLLLVGLCPAITLVLFGPRLFEWIFGSKWVEAGMMAAWAAPRFLAQFVVSPLSRVVLVVGRPEIKFIYDIMTFAGTIAVFAIAHHQGWPVITLVAALAALNTAAYAVFFVLLLNISSTRRHESRVAIEDVP
jgi:O-antigen/teichoic acid export membrane protein